MHTLNTDKCALRAHTYARTFEKDRPSGVGNRHVEVLTGGFKALGFRASGLGFRASGFGFRVYGLRA